MQKVGSELMLKLSRLLKTESGLHRQNSPPCSPRPCPAQEEAFFFLEEASYSEAWLLIVDSYGLWWEGFPVAVSRAPATWLQRTRLWLGAAWTIL